MKAIYKTSGSLLADILNKQFEVENLGALESNNPPSRDIRPGPKPCERWSPEQLLADTLMMVTHSGDPQNPHFMAQVPWRQNHGLRLSGNFHVVEQRQARTHSASALAKKGIRPREVDQIVLKYREKGYVEAVPESEKTQGWYLSVFEVVN